MSARLRWSPVPLLMLLVVACAASPCSDHPVTIEGFVAPGFEEVEREFRRSFDERGELGAAVAVYVRGEKVVDLWGGHRDPESCAPWEEDTLVGVFSTTKGMAAVAMAVAHSRGWFELDEPVATWWPEFAANGKGAITVRELFDHRAGLAVLDEPLSAGVIADPDRLAALLARSAPAWEPGTRHGYHGLTLGFYQSELLRRVDPAGRTLGVFLREEVMEPLGEELYIGLPPEVDRSRLARLTEFRAREVLAHPGRLPFGLALGFVLPWTDTARALTLPDAGGGANALFAPGWGELEIPSANGIGTARAIACVYGALAHDPARLGVTEGTLDEICAPVTPCSGGDRDLILHTETAYAFGFSRPWTRFRFGSSERAFGAQGMGGSLGFADPDTGLGYAFVTNRMGTHLFDDPRDMALRQAVVRCVERRNGDS